MSEVSSNIARFLTKKAGTMPDACALKHREASGGYNEWSFKKLEEMSSKVARDFEGKGICQGSKVLLMVRPGVELILIAFALFKIGAVPVIIDPGMGVSNFLKCVERTQPEALVGIPLAHWLKRLFSKKFRSVKIAIKVKPGAFIDQFKKSDTGIFEPVQSKAEDLAAILFTSGSTGAPKGVLYTHGIFEAQLGLIAGEYGIKEGEVDLPLLPIFALFNPALGMTTVVAEINASKPASVDPARIVNAIVENGVSNSFGSPAIWHKIADYCEAKEITLASIKRILMAGAPVPKGLVERFRKIIPNGRIHTPYGATEVLPVTSISTEAILNEKSEGTCLGRPVHSMRAQIIRAKEGEIASIDLVEKLGVGEIGEIIVRGPTVTAGYHELPEATRLAKIQSDEGLWHRMGDLGYFDSEGRLFFCGRKVECVYLKNGETLYTAPCEAVFNKQDGVYRSALIGWEGVAGMVIQPEVRSWKKIKSKKAEFIEELKRIASEYEITREIRHFFIEKSLPVDVRHNAKIHRLSLSKKFSKQLI